MPIYSVIVGIFGCSLEALLLYRGWRGRLFNHFALFFSYLAYVLVGSTATFGTYYLRPHLYPRLFWYFFLIGLLAEFAVLAQIGDHVFKSYPAIRMLGRFLVSLVVVISFASIAPSLASPLSHARALLDLAKGMMLTKAVIVVLLFMAARYVGIPLGRNVAGMLLGFSLYVGVNMANFALDIALGPGVYGQVFSTIGPLSWNLALLVWTMALWRYEPVIPARVAIRVGESKSPESLRYRLEQFNTTLGSLLRK